MCACKEASVQEEDFTEGINAHTDEKQYSGNNSVSGVHGKVSEVKNKRCIRFHPFGRFRGHDFGHMLLGETLVMGIGKLCSRSSDASENLFVELDPLNRGNVSWRNLENYL